MKGFITFIKDNKRFFTALISLTICISLVSCKGSRQQIVQVEEKVQAKAAGQVFKAENILDKTVIDKMKLISSMFPDKKFTKQGKYYSTEEFENYYIDSMIPGSFVNKDSDELLVIVRRKRSELSHADGYYNAYMAIFDNSSGKMISEVKFFSGDEGSYHLFEGNGIYYIFFRGYSMFQGYEFFDGSLWRAGKQWSIKWPEVAGDEELRNYWKDKALEVNDFGVEILKKKLRSSNDLDYTWEESESLMWDDENEIFKP